MVIRFEEARQIILDQARPLGKECVSLAEACGRVLAEAVCAPWDLPAWDNSAMDGFAVRSRDCRAAKPLQVSGYIPAGAPARERVEQGGAIRIMTGAPLPAGADAVVPVEEVAEADGWITLTARVGPGQHIRRQGEDVARGKPFMAAGTRLRPDGINLLASFGQAFVPVFRRPRVAILSTGDELVELGEMPAPGQIINSNSLSLAAAVREAGAEPLLLGIARDEVDSLRLKLAEGLKADILISSAGVSAGDRDLVRDVLADLGVRELFWKVAIKPGHPTAFGVKGDCLVFSLPGNPVSTLMTFEFLVKPALERIGGSIDPVKPRVRAVLRESTKKKKGRLQFMRVSLTQDGDILYAASAGDQHTGMVSTMVRAEGIAILPGDEDRVAAGTLVDVYLLD